MKYIVDAALCSGHGQCYAVAPEVYTSDDDGFNSNVGRTVEVPDGLKHTASYGAGACPEQAIRVFA